MQFSGEGCPLPKDVGPRAGRSKRALEVFCFSGEVIFVASLTPIRSTLRPRPSRNEPGPFLLMARAASQKNLVSRKIPDKPPRSLAAPAMCTSFMAVRISPAARG